MAGRGITSSGCDVATSAVSGVNTGADASIMSASMIGMAGMLAWRAPCAWVAGRCTASMIVSVGATCVGMMSDRTSPVSDWPATTSPAPLWYASDDVRGACMWLLAGGWLCGRMPPSTPAAGTRESSPAIGAVGTARCTSRSAARSKGVARSPVDGCRLGASRSGVG